jgi:hypothetical protein
LLFLGLRGLVLQGLVLVGLALLVRSLVVLSIFDIAMELAWDSGVFKVVKRLIGVDGGELVLVVLALVILIEGCIISVVGDLNLVLLGGKSLEFLVVLVFFLGNKPLSYFCFIKHDFLNALKALFDDVDLIIYGVSLLLLVRDARVDECVDLL